MCTPISVRSPVSVSDAMGDVYLARISVDVHKVLLGTWGYTVYSCGSTRRNTVNSFCLTVGLSNALFHLQAIPGSL